MFEETEGHEADHVLPIVVSLVGQFFLHHRSNGNHGCESVPEQYELKKELPTHLVNLCEVFGADSEEDISAEPAAFPIFDGESES